MIKQHIIRSYDVHPALTPLNMLKVKSDEPVKSN